MDQSPENVADDSVDVFCDGSLGLDQVIPMGFSATFGDNLAIHPSSFIDLRLEFTTGNCTELDNCASTPIPITENDLLQTSLISDISPGQTPDRIEHDNTSPSTQGSPESSQLRSKHSRGRKERKTGTQGPNRYGRKGTKRCEVCRHWRRKVRMPLFL